MPNRRKSPDIPDPIRTADTADTGDLGEAATVKAFAQLGWPATLTTAAQDHGTDVLIAVRDRGFNRGEFLGAQVKAGKTNLSSRIKNDGKHIGWWVKVKPKHANYWIDNALPHILVLYDHSTDLCHWVHLTDESIKKTGKGRKVKVPVDHVISRKPAQIKELLAVAATARAPVPLEGTVWTGSTPKAPTDHLRFALIAPRLMAPHPNSGQGPSSPEQAVALLMQARITDVWRPMLPREGIPPRSEAADHDVWAWRFAVALADWLTKDQEPNLTALRNSSVSAHEHAALAAMMAHLHISAGNPGQARAILQREIDADEMAPVDHAWIHLQLARAHQELGNLDEAREAATESLAVGSTQRHDVTATAIRGVAAAMLFGLSPFADQDIASTIRFNDTAVAWWRSQTSFRGTVALIETVFDRAVGHEPSTHDGNTAYNQLLAASAQAGFLGSQGQWRHLHGLQARQELIEDSQGDPGALAKPLKALCRAGAESPVSEATRWLVINGPADAVSIAAREINLSRSMSSTIDAELIMLRDAGDVIEAAPQQRRLIGWRTRLRIRVDSSRSLTTLPSIHHSGSASVSAGSTKPSRSRPLGAS